MFLMMILALHVFKKAELNVVCTSTSIPLKLISIKYNNINTLQVSTAARIACPNRSHVKHNQFNMTATLCSVSVCVCVYFIARIYCMLSTVIILNVKNYTYNTNPHTYTHTLYLYVSWCEHMYCTEKNNMTRHTTHRADLSHVWCRLKYKFNCSLYQYTYRKTSETRSYL